MTTGTGVSMETPNPIALFRDYFSKRGISSDVIDQNDIRLVTFDQLAEMRPRLPRVKGQAGFAALIPYRDIEGNPIEYHTARVLQLQARPNSFSSLGLEDAKLLCPSGQTHAYFPANNPAPSRNVRCVVTESAVKAIVAANCGFYAIGLNGCWGFRSRFTTDRLLPDLNRVPWRQFKDIVFVPDSNVEGNDDVTAASARFCSDMLQLHRVEPKLIIIPKDPEGEDWGLDDYYAQYGDAKATELLSGEGIDPPLDEFLEAMHDINRQVTYVETADVFAVHSENILITEKHFHNLYATTTYTNADGARKPASRAWKSWEGRHVARRVINRPGAPMEYQGDYNLWRPSEVEPYEGDVTNHLTFLENAVPDEAERRWLQSWVAHAVQQQDVKMNTALVFFSNEQGTGKSMMADVVGGMLGRQNTRHVSMDILTSSFNSSYAGRQLVVINESNADVRSSRALMDKLKALVTEPIVEYHAKGRDPIEIENFSNIILTTNHADALQIDPSDRRFAVFEFKSQFRWTREAELWGEECYRWHMDNLEELLFYYLNYDLQGFDPAAPALLTSAKQEIAEGSYTEYDHLARDLSDPSTRADALEGLGLRRDVRYVEGSQLAKLAFPTANNTRSTATRIASSMKKFQMERQKFSVQTPHGRKTVRVYDLVGGDSDSEQVGRDVLEGSGNKY